VTVYLVGAGPGDPRLITVRGLELVRSCEALVYDALVAPELVAEAPEDALLVSREGLRQEEIDELLVKLGQGGYRTVRLKGGDPFVFGRGGEEALALAAAGIPFEVVPGVSAAAAVPAALDIPITHRGVSAQVTLVSGHSASGDELDYEHLAQTQGTLVFFMALGQVEEIAVRLIAAGKNPATPAAVISRGTLPDQRAVIGELRTIGPLARGLRSPALVVVGEVVAVPSAANAPAHAA
jgi:uroporphyrin-III C-methyltransferase